MKLSCFLSAFLFLSNTSFAQTLVRSDLGSYTSYASGPATWKSTCRSYDDKYVIEGSPYFEDVWSKGKIITPDRKVYVGIELKIDILADHVHFRDSSGREGVTDGPLKEVLIEQNANTRTLHFIHGTMLPTPQTGWFQILVNDTVSLVKGWKKYMDKRISYSNGPELRIITEVFYIAYFYYQEFKIKNADDFARIFPSKKEEIKAYEKALKKELSTDEKLSSMALFCNSFKGMSRF